MSAAALIPLSFTNVRRSMPPRPSRFPTHRFCQSPPMLTRPSSSAADPYDQSYALLPPLWTGQIPPKRQCFHSVRAVVIYLLVRDPSDEGGECPRTLPRSTQGGSGGSEELGRCVSSPRLWSSSYSSTTA